MEQSAIRVKTASAWERGIVTVTHTRTHAHTPHLWNHSDSETPTENTHTHNTHTHSHTVTHTHTQEGAKLKIWFLNTQQQKHPTSGKLFLLFTLIQSYTVNHIIWCFIWFVCSSETSTIKNPDKNIKYLKQHYVTVGEQQRPLQRDVVETC